MTLHELRAYRTALRDKLRQLDDIKATCHDCENLEAGACIKFGATPPPEFQKTAEACAEWQYDYVPF